MEHLLRKLRDIAFANIGLRELPDFVQEHIDILIELGADPNSKLCCGNNGCIITTYDRNWVIKITKDLNEINLFTTIQNERIKSGFVRVKEIITFPSFWAIIVKQRIMPLDQMTRDYDGVTAEYINFMHVYYQEMHDVEQKRKSLTRAISTLRSHSFKNVVDMFLSLRKLAYAGYRLQDIDPDNVGFAEGDQLVIFDAQIYML